MADTPPGATPTTDTGVGPDRGSTTGTPRWVKVFGTIAFLLVLLLVIALLTGGGGHGPGRHTGSGDTGREAPPAGGDAPSGGAGHAPPAGGHTLPDRRGGRPR